jgi:TIR domain
MIGDWRVRSLPRCTHHVFLSHCAEDRARLVQPVFEELQNANYSPWFDQHHYPAGQDAYEALREGILQCRHVVHFVTAKFLAQGRGWNSVENAYANLLQTNLHERGLELCHVQLPLIFIPQGNPTLLRSAWGPLTSRALSYPSARVDGGAVDWAIQQIIGFIRQEEIRGAGLAIQVQNDPGFHPLLHAEQNLLRRIMCADPPTIP